MGIAEVYIMGGKILCVGLAILVTGLIVFCINEIRKLNERYKYG